MSRNIILRTYFTTDSQSVSMSLCRAHSGTCDQILLPVWRFLTESWCLVSMGYPLWREDGSAVCSTITQWSESLRTRNHTLLSHLRLPQPGRRSKLLYDWQSVSQSVSMSWYRTLLWDLRPDITSCRNVPIWNLQSCFVGRPLWREDRSAICSVITQWSESYRTRKYTLLSHLGLPQSGGPCSRTYIPQKQGGPVIPPGTG
jgi:hypothetical protein